MLMQFFSYQATAAGASERDIVFNTSPEIYLNNSWRQHAPTSIFCFFFSARPVYTEKRRVKSSVARAQYAEHNEFSCKR